MLIGSCNTIVLEKEYTKKNNFICKFFYGIIFRIQFGFLALKINKSKENKNIIFLSSIDPLVGLIVKCISIFTKSKLIIERNEFPSAIRVSKKLEKILYTIFILSWQYKLYDGLFLMTDELIHFYKKYARKNCIIEKLPMTVDFERFNKKKVISKTKEKYIAYTGSLSNEKDGIEYLLKAFSAFSNTHTDIKLKIAGGTPLQIRELKKNTQNLNVFAKVEFLGTIESNHIPPLIMNALALVLPRPDSIQARGGFPTKLGEYLATSNPVVVTKVGEIPKYLTKNDAFFINPNNIESELIEALKVIFDDYNKALKIGAHGKEKAFKYFSLENNQGKVANLINAVAKGGKSNEE